MSLVKDKEAARIILNYKNKKGSSSFSKVKPEATVEDIYDTAEAINSLQLERELDNVQKVYSYTIVNEA